MQEFPKAEVVQIVTPGKIVLDGLWFGEDRVKRAFIFVHGLASSVFAHHDLLLPLLNRETGLLFFNNRGHDQVTGIKKIDRRKKKGYSRIPAGEVHEVFTECRDDIQGAVNAVKARGAAEIYLAGHSTGCQKSVYYLSRRGKQQQVTGAILLAPMSDYAGAVKTERNGELKKALNAAQQMISEGKAAEMLPAQIWPGTEDAQRFISLYTPDSPEEIFCYCQKNKKPETLKKIKLPMLTILAGDDGYRDRPIKQIAKWFEKNLRHRDQMTMVIDSAPHGFDGYEKTAAGLIRNWVGGTI